MRKTTKMGAVEALLFVAAVPLTVQQVAETLDGEVSPGEARDILDELAGRYENDSPGLKIERVAEGYRLVTRPEHFPFVRAFLKVQNLRKLSSAAVETLAITAYNQPVTNAGIGTIRGRESAGVLKGLLEKKLVRIAGRKDVVGRPLLYATTKEFLVHFGLNSLEDLPSFRELEEVFKDRVRQESLFTAPETREPEKIGSATPALPGTTSSVSAFKPESEKEDAGELNHGN